MVRRRADGLLALGVVGLVLFGTVMIYSASVIVGYTKYGDPQFFFKRQLISVFLGIIALVVGVNIDYRVWQRSAKWMLLLTLLLLISVFIFSKGEINGAHRWISVGSLSFQPSELAKFTFLAYLSAWLGQRREQVASMVHTFLPFVATITVVAVLMLLQPDFGTLTVILVASLATYFVAGMTGRQMLIGVLLLGLGLSVILAAPYRRARLAAFFNPEQDTSGVSYHVKNISIAIGSGGWFGLGFGESGQKRLFLPEPHTDSIFAITVEELGFIVSSLVIGVIALVIYRGYRVAARAPEPFAQYLATGITTWFGYQAFLNLAAMLQLVPLKGVPLPFISYGGTNLVVSLFAVGVLLAISKEAVEKPAEEPGVNRRRSHYRS